MTVLVVVRIYFVMELRDSGAQQASSGIGLRNGDSRIAAFLSALLALFIDGMVIYSFKDCPVR